MHRTTVRGGRSLTSCRKAASVLADGMPCTFLRMQLSWASTATPCVMVGPGHEFETRHPLHFGCVLSLRCRATWCWRCGMCAAQGLSHVQRDTTSDGMLAFGHSRSGRVWTRRQHKEPSSSSRFGGGNRPQRLGGAGTRDRMDLLLRSLSGQNCCMRSGCF